MGKSTGEKIVKLSFTLTGEAAEKFEVIKAYVGATRNTDAGRQAIERVYSGLIKNNKREELLNELTAKGILDVDGALNSLRTKTKEIEGQFGDGE